MRNPRQTAIGKRRSGKADGKRQKAESLFCCRHYFSLPSAFCLLPFVLALVFVPLRVAGQGTSDAETVRAQEAADLELISAVERVVSRAITKAERSVVSIARRKRDAGPQFADSHPGMAFRTHDTSMPLDPNFAASEFATGVVIDARGLILTNRHVLGEEPEDNDFFVTTADRKVFTVKVVDRKLFPMKVKASDAMSDLAVLQPLQDGAVRTGDFLPIQFGDASTLRKGQIVIALGNPYGIARDGQASASWGIVANLARKAATISEEDIQKPLYDYGTLIQTDAKLNLGTSGGALINVRGEMVGLTTSLAAANGFEQPAGYAIPIDKSMLRIIQALKEGREVEYGLLGIVPENLRRDEMKRGTPGILVSQIVPGGPAAKANLRQNDIITRVDNKVIYDKDALRLHVSKLPPGSITTLTVWRPTETKPFERRVVLGKQRIELPQTYTQRPPAWRGLIVDHRMPKKHDLAQFPIASPSEDFSTPSVAVREVAEGTATWQAGLREGMLISHVGSAPVATPADFHTAVASQSGPVKLRLLSTTDGGKQTIVVPAD